ncbi:hypothetical protein L218DRAFT_254205 [Marasmius fiardii PR-910]|nr:hypothetical protein L218DRAFT_254205 [Marasmius fiardii PR-910]
MVSFRFGRTCEKRIRIYHARTRCTKEFWSSKGYTNQYHSDVGTTSIVSKVVDEMFISGGNLDDSWIKSHTSCVEDEYQIMTEEQSESLQATVETKSESVGTTGSQISPEKDGSLQWSERKIEGTYADSNPAMEGPSSTDQRAIYEIVRAVLKSGGSSSNDVVLSVVPSVCKKKHVNCQDDKRCYICCFAQLKLYQPLPRAKTVLGQAFLDCIWDLEDGNGTFSDIILRDAVKKCGKAETKCGLSRRCAKCFRKAAVLLLERDEIL